MTTHSSASARERSPHANRTSRTNTILNALTRRAQAILNDESIDAESRAIIRYAMEINDPWLAKLVKRAEAGETVIDANGSLDTNEISNTDSSVEKIEALAELICRSGQEPSARCSCSWRHYRRLPIQKRLRTR